ncbi:unnamed protein product [Symbiodinium sp. CCMP2592]|nr:unnamed protein product [Symbiodinium sp. CCMP2592]
MMARLRSLLPEFGPQALSNAVQALARPGSKGRKTPKQAGPSCKDKWRHSGNCWPQPVGLTDHGKAQRESVPLLLCSLRKFSDFSGHDNLVTDSS